MATAALPWIGELGGAQRSVVFNGAAHAAYGMGHYEQAKTLGATTTAESDTVTVALIGSR